MPTLSLFTRPANPNESHRVQAPGGFERWHFDAEASSGNRRIVIDFFEGFPFHPAYFWRYQRYLRWPTRFPPPTPPDFPAVSFTLFEGLEPIARMFHLGSSATSSSQAKYGPNSFVTNDDGTMRLRLRGAPWTAGQFGPTLLDQKTLNAEFTFTPNRAMQSRIELLDPLAEASEYDQYQVSQSVCDVRGEVHLYGQGTDSAGPIDLQFDGQGFFDHFLGLSPLSECIPRLMYGRVLLPRRALVLEVMQEKSPAITRGELLQLDSSGEHVVDAGEMKIDWSATPLRIGAPSRVSFAGQLELSNARVLEANAVSAQVLYDAIAGDEKGTALCEVAYPTRVGSVVQGLWLERWFDRANSAQNQTGE